MGLGSTLTGLVSVSEALKKGRLGLMGALNHLVRRINMGLQARCIHGYQDLIENLCQACAGQFPGLSIRMVGSVRTVN